NSESSTMIARSEVFIGAPRVSNTNDTAQSRASRRQITLKPIGWPVNLYLQRRRSWSDSPYFGCYNLFDSWNRPSCWFNRPSSAGLLRSETFERSRPSSFLPRLQSAATQLPQSSRRLARQPRNAVLSDRPF